MSKTGATFKSLLENWNALKDQRPSESDFSPHGVQLSYKALDEYYSRLQIIIDGLDAKGYWTSSPEAAVADQPIANSLNSVNSLLINARSNGVGWMLGSGFLEALNNSRQLLSTLTRSQASLNKEIAKVLSEKSDADIELVIAASASAQEISELQKLAHENANRVADNSRVINEALTVVDEKRKNVIALAEESSQQAESIKTIHSESEASKEVIEKIKSRAIAQEEMLVTKLDAVDKRVTDTDAAARAALDSVSKALKQVRDQGLASAFQSRSSKIQTERKIWAILFLISIAILLILSINFALNLTPLTYEVVIVNLLKKLGLAAPTIWLGWYSAAQLGRVSRVQEDYEYKAASALAYQSYRDEIGILSSDVLTEKLAAIAIANFGDNPVRLYGDGKNSDPVTPVQAAIQELPPDKIAAVLAAVGEQAVKIRSRLK